MNLLLALLAVAVLSPPAPARLVWQGGARVPLIALTFDAGADRGYAPAILATLEHTRTPASFGMTGLWARTNPDLVRRMARDGDAFINHTYDHRSFTGLSTHTAPLSVPQRAWEITQTERVIHRLTGKTPKPYFRPPYGDFDSSTLAQIGRLGYRYSIMWTIDTLGWDHLPAASIVQRCLTMTHAGAIILMHVGSQSQDGVALASVIAGLRRRGFRFVTVPHLLSAH